jgi:acetolactate decarboxylase
MVIVDGTAYAVRDDGTTDTLDARTGIPFGVVTPFEVDTTLALNTVDGFADLQSRLDEKLPSANQLYAFRITGEFDHLQTRSVTAQQPPYPPLETVIADQTEFTFEDIKGATVGFHIPDVFDGVNSVGHHAHFVTANRDGGGHVLEVRSSKLEVQVDRASSIRVVPLEL